MFAIGVFLVLSHWRDILIGIGLIFIFGALYLITKVGRKWYKKHIALIELRKMAQELGAKDIEIDNENGRISFIVPEGSANEELRKISESLSQKGLRMNISSTKYPREDDEMDVKDCPKTVSSTDVGFINKNEQRNNGRTSQQGTDNNQFFYEMECLKCGHIYYANGTDIWQRKCPICQGGKP
jgi:rubrerythrin